MKSINRRFSSELRKAGFVQIKERLAELADRDGKKVKAELTEIFVNKAPAHTRVNFKYLIPVFLVLFLFFFIFSGGVYRVLLPRTYGELSIAMIPLSDDGFFSLYRENYEELIPLKEGRFNKKGLVSLYLREGSYRIAIESGSNMTWRTVYIPSFYDSKGSSLDLTVLSSPLEQFPLDLKFTVKDRFSSTDIRSLSEVSILTADGWQNLNDAILKDLKTGRTVDLKISSPGYKEEQYTLDIENHQTSVQLDVLLSPLASLVKINSFDGLISLNGRDEYFSLKSLQFEDLNKTVKENRVLALLPGKYSVYIESGDSTLEETIRFESAGEYNLNIIRNEENGIKIEMAGK
jgi:hypothetical protein